MDTPKPAPTHAPISDDLAQMFLRDRDIHCPRCQYPLRNANSNTCPECGCQLTVFVCDSANPEPSRKLIRSCALLLFLYSVSAVTANIASLIGNLILDSIPATLVHGIFFFGANVLWLIIMFWTARIWSRTRREIPTPPSAVIKPATVCVVLSFIGAAFQIYATLTLAWWLL